MKVFKKYLIYIDDKNSLHFLNFLDKKHPNFKFTMKTKLTIPLLSLMCPFQVSIK